MNIVLNFHKNDQYSARTLLEIIMSLNEGTETQYFLQYGDCISSLEIHETLLRFLCQKKAIFSNELPSINIPLEMIQNDPNSQQYEGLHTRKNRRQKHKILQWNLSLFKYINKLDFFLMLEPDCLILKNEWLKQIYDGFAKRDNHEIPIFGHLKRGKISGNLVPTHFAGCSVYNGRQLRKLPLEKYFYERYENPWWLLRNTPDTTKANNAFIGPVFSGYDVSYDYFIFALYFKEITGSNNPSDWSTYSIKSREDLIFCDFNSRLSIEQIIEKYYGKLPLLHGVKDDAARQAILRIVRSGSINANCTFPLSGTFHSTKQDQKRPVNTPIEDYRHLNILKSDNSALLSIRDIQNQYIGKRCFIIGNGPSLKRTDLSRLKNEFTVGLNRIYLNYPVMGFEPTFYCCTNVNVVQQFVSEIDRLNSIKFISNKAVHILKNTWNTFFFDSSPGIGFNENLNDCRWYEGWTVTYCAMQVAFHLGFQEVILVGIDHFFPNAGNPNKTVTETEKDINHFHPDYFGKGVVWQYPDLERSEESYKIAKQVYEQNNRRIIDATIDGHLKIFDKVDYDYITTSFTACTSPSPGKVSIVMPAYNAEPFIYDAINSVLNQTYNNWELIIVNDGSQDNTKQIIESFNDPRIICIDQKNLGRAKARNKALKSIHGEYVAFLDADDFYMPKKLELQVKFLQENEKAGAVVGGVRRITEKGHTIKVIQHSDGQVIPNEDFLLKNPAHLQSTMFRHQWVNSSVLFNPEACAGEDWEFNIRLALAGCLFIRQSPVVCSYRCTEQAKSKITESYAEAMIAIVDRILDSMETHSIYKSIENKARYQVNLRMAARFFSTEQYAIGQKYFNRALQYVDKCDNSFYQTVSNALVGWLIQLDAKNPSQILKMTISHLPDNIDKKCIEKLSQVKLRSSSLDSCLIKSFARKSHAHLNETLLVCNLLSELPRGSVMLDVGAHHGSAFSHFVKKGWRIYAFEPDPVNREELLKQINGNSMVTLDSRAVSDRSLDRVSFFSSEESTGISSLTPFLDSHKEKCVVSTTTVAEFCQEHNIQQIDFLKIDAEGYDLMVLKGVPWDEVRPRVIECEYEDSKTIPLGYNFHDLAQFLIDQGYSVLVSEWHPVVQYGIQHDWHRLVPYPCNLANNQSWGNLIAFREPPDWAKVSAIAKKLVKTASQKKSVVKASSIKKAAIPVVKESNSVLHNQATLNKVLPTSHQPENNFTHMSREMNPEAQQPKNETDLNSIQKAVALLGRVANYYRRWPVVLAASAIALNTAAMFEVPFRWALMTGGTTLLLFLIGHAASKADVALEAADTASRKASEARRISKKASQTASKALNKGNKTTETVNAALRNTFQVAETADTALQNASQAAETANTALQNASQAAETTNTALQIANSTLQTANYAAETTDTALQSASKATETANNSLQLASQAAKTANSATVEFQQILQKSNSFNSSLFQGFDRQLSHDNLKQLISFWLPTLNLKLDRRAIGYLAHRICLSEDTCSGRLATSVQDMLLRILVARSISSPYLSVLEIGTLFGVNLAILYESCRSCFQDVHLTAIDPLAGYYDESVLDIITKVPVSRAIFEHNMRRMDVKEKDWTIIQGLSNDESTLDKARRMKYNLLIIDGDHSYEGVKFDFDNYNSLIEPGGFIIFDDYGSDQWPNVTKFVDQEVKQHSGLNLIGVDWRTAVFQVICKENGKY